ncbi:phenylacetate--CoA ligase family protein [Photorhabdus heterorhabditis]|uniref:phenylacetate--CoA ligase family protein n=1 Tax=Photorhabdus heterorhabditis TaxID=880156 RepID=UPI001BD2B494|nr:phenylacetate--CoA ligase family protein [Photorhabdus heterorhabditis]MBS9443895.1 phenylacetate--CoA ligase family protein [Photorhabdus heterorhabditis]
MTLPLHDLVEYARDHAPFFRDLYRDLPRSGWTLTDLPLIDPANYWQQSQPLENWPVLTGPINGGHVFKTGGSTSEGRLSVFSCDEWRAFVRAFGQGLAQQLQPGDRVANLFFAGDLYTSLLFIHGALSYSPVPVVEYPFTCSVDDQALADAVVSLGINVLAGVPVQLLRFASTLQQLDQSMPNIERLLYGGESLFTEQLTLLSTVFPNARIGSIGCASVDAGLIGAAAPDCCHGEHRVFDTETIVEIIDESSGQPITVPGQNGLLVVTNLQRCLMPVIRYPTGDMACWCEAPGKPHCKFVLQGRAGSAHRVRVSTLSLFPDQIAHLLQQQAGILAWQLLLSRQDGIDKIKLLLARDQSSTLSTSTVSIHQALLAAQPAIAKLCCQGGLYVEVVDCALENMLTHPRSGKLMRVVDHRGYCVEEKAA